ncbi:MAG: hypothetical protein IJ274_01830 [Lachnospiraceae bacterium]|nr:hypothetical protein [Lachnospiraceae bacterium]
MEQFKKILLKLLFPHKAVIISSAPVATALLVYAFAYENANSVVSYIAYVFSAYALTIVCVKAPKLFQKIKEAKKRNKYITLYQSDAQLRVKISLYSSVVFNILYALLQLFSGFHFHSIWFYALAGYYTLLAVMRFFLLKDARKIVAGENKFYEYLLYRLCGILLLLMNLTLGVIVFYIVWQNRGFEYHYIHTITMAAYTFTAMTLAVINVIKYRRFESPLMSAARVISLASALVSILSLETAMLTAFGAPGTDSFRQLMTALTGAAVCLLILAMAIYMIIHSTKKIKKLKKEVHTNE